MANPSQFSYELVMSKTLAEARKKAVDLYTDCIRAIPFLQKNYQLEFSKESIQQRIRSEFLKHGNLTDPKTIDILVWKGRSDLNEALSMFKTRSHVWSQLNPATSAREIPKRSQMSLSSNYEQASSDYRPGKH